jgi:hypothetical protein
VTQAARELQIAPSTLLRWLDDGFVAGEQITPGAPWQIRLTDQLRAMLTDSTPDGWVPLAYATRPSTRPPHRLLHTASELTPANTRRHALHPGPYPPDLSRHSLRGFSH